MSRRTLGRRKVVVFVGLGFAVAGGWLAIGAPAPALFGMALSLVALMVLGRDLWTLRDAARWPQATARVVESRITTIVQERQGLGARTLHGPLIRYVYDPGSGEVTSWNGSFDGIDMRSDREAAEAVVRAYPVGSRIEIGYCPRQPERSRFGGATIPHTKLWVTAGFLAMFAITFGALI